MCFLLKLPFHSLFLLGVQGGVTPTSKKVAYNSINLGVKKKTVTYWFSTIYSEGLHKSIYIITIG